MSSHLPIELCGLGYAARGSRLLEGISLRVRAGRRLIVLGPNGAGKSLLLRLCHGLLLPSQGEIRTGLGVGVSREVRARQAMVFQRPVLLRRGALANVSYALAVRGVAWRQRRTLAAAALERFGLAALAERPARVLSGGEQQRLTLARAWALSPELLLLDEPTAALDPTATRAVEEAILAFHGQGAAILMSTHDLGQARRLAEEVAFLHHGRLLETGPATEFFASPTTPQAAAFLRGELVP